MLLVQLGRDSHVDSLLHLAGIRDTRKLRTIMAAEVIARIRLVQEGIELRESEVSGIIEDRNAAAHLHVLPVGLHRAFVRWIKAMEIVLGKLDESPATFWPDPDMVQTALDNYDRPATQ